MENDKSLVVGWVGQVQMLVLLDEGPEADTWCRKSLEPFPAMASCWPRGPKRFVGREICGKRLGYRDAALASAGTIGLSLASARRNDGGCQTGRRQSLL